MNPFNRHQQGPSSVTENAAFLPCLMQPYLDLQPIWARRELGEIGYTFAIGRPNCGSGAHIVGPEGIKLR
jgi:hypothetical protein